MVNLKKVGITMSNTKITTKGFYETTPIVIILQIKAEISQIKMR